MYVSQDIGKHYQRERVRLQQDRFTVQHHVQEQDDNLQDALPKDSQLLRK